MVRLAKATSSMGGARDSLPATTRLRAGILIAADGEALVEMFGAALAEHGVTGHFCIRERDGLLQPILGDDPSLVGRQHDCLVVSAAGGVRILLRRPNRPLSPEEMTRMTGYAHLFAARAFALQELADDVDTGCGLTLRERYVLGRRLAGLAPVDIAIETGLSVATVSAALDGATNRLGADSIPAAIAFAARRGWLAVTSIENCSSSSEKISYRANKNG